MAALGILVPSVSVRIAVPQQKSSDFIGAFLLGTSTFLNPGKHVYLPAVGDADVVDQGRDGADGCDEVGIGGPFQGVDRLRLGRGVGDAGALEPADRTGAGIHFHRKGDDAEERGHGKQGDALLIGPCFEFTEENVDEAVRLLGKTINEVI